MYQNNQWVTPQVQTVSQSGVITIITRLTDQADALLKKFIDDPSSELIQKALETLWSRIAELTKDQKDIDISKEETERIRLQQATYAIQSQHWRDVQISQDNVQISNNYWQQQQAMHVAYQNGMNATFQALVSSCPQAVTNLIESSTVRTNGEGHLIEQRNTP